MSPPENIPATSAATGRSGDVSLDEIDLTGRTGIGVRAWNNDWLAPQPSASKPPRTHSCRRKC